MTRKQKVQKLQTEASRSKPVQKVVQELQATSRLQDSTGKETDNSNRSDRTNGTSGATAKLLKYLDDFRSPSDIRQLRSEGYEIDYDRLVGVGISSAVFLAHLLNAPTPALARNGQRPLYTPGYDIAVKVVANKLVDARRPSKIRTGNLKLALALGKTTAENNILKVIDVFKTADRIFIFMQYCAYGNVISFIRRNGQVPSRLSQRWSTQMASALSFLHKFHVAHRNYKLENVLVDGNLNAKLTGFGLSKFCLDLQSKQPIMSRTICGSEPYLAPEMLKDINERFYDPKVADIWAYGVGVFLCITKRYPFEGENLRALKQDQLARRYLERDAKRRLRSPVRQLLASIFVVEPNQRPTMQDLLHQSSWLAQQVKQLLQQGTSTVSTNTPAGCGGGGGNQPKTAPNAGQTGQQPRPGVTGAGPSAGQKPAGATRNTSQRQSDGQRTSSPVADESSPQQGEQRNLSPVTPVSFQPDEVLPVSSDRIDQSYM